MKRRSRPQHMKETKIRPSFYRLISLLLILSLITLTHLPKTLGATTGTNSESFATLNVVVRTTEPSSDIPYILRLTVSEISETSNTNMLRFVVWVNPNQRPIMVDSVTGESIYTGSATVKLPLGSYRIELPSDSRWRYKDFESSNGVDAIDDSLDATITPSENFSGFSNNRVGFSLFSATDEVTCTINTKRSSERWLTATHVTPSFTS